MGMNFKPCAIRSCTKNARSGSRGWCSSHYNRWLRHGDPLGGAATPAPNGAPLAWVVDTALNYFGDDCLTWPFGDDGEGYGQIIVDGKKVRAHRWVCEQIYGPPPSQDYHAAHSCGRGKMGCISRSHLSWKTPKENCADKLEHGTHTRGERCGTSKLTAPEVHLIRQRLANGENKRLIAGDFGVTDGAIRKIAARDSWAWLEERSSV